MSGDQTNEKIGGPHHRKKKESVEEKITWEENDFVDEKELKSALQLGVLKTADSIALRVGGRNGLDMVVNEDVVNQVAAIVWDTVSENWTEDLARFAAHAGRQKVAMEDISLLTRRNPDLLQAACKLAGVSCQQQLMGQTKGKGRKRKKDDISTSNQRSNCPEDGIECPANRAIQTPKAQLKTSKLETDVPSIRVTSTPKATEKSLHFPCEITPIRPTDSTIFNSKSVNLSVIEEEMATVTEDEQNRREEAEGNPVSFDVFGATRSTITDFSSLLKRAEEHDSLIMEPTKERIEKERLERMVPDEEFENDSFDSFDNYNLKNEHLAEKSPDNTSKNAVFSNKISAFAFDDDDSFDEPTSLKPAKPLQQTPSASMKRRERNASETTPTNSSVLKKSKTRHDDHDSFDEFDFDI